MCTVYSEHAFYFLNQHPPVYVATTLTIATRMPWLPLRSRCCLARWLCSSPRWRPKSCCWIFSRRRRRRKRRRGGGGCGGGPTCSKNDVCFATSGWNIRNFDIFCSTLTTPTLNGIWRMILSRPTLQRLLPL